MRSSNTARLAALEAQGAPAAHTISAGWSETTEDALKRRGLTDFKGRVYVVRCASLEVDHA